MAMASASALTNEGELTQAESTLSTWGKNSRGEWSMSTKEWKKMRTCVL
jgi:hypothetical protein